MALLTVEDLEAAMGGITYTDAQAAQAQYYIDTVSSFLEDVTGVTFSRIINDTVRCHSDDRGTIVLTIEPVSDVSNVYDRESQTDAIGWYWNGDDEILGLLRDRVYDVTMSYGIYPVPADIKGVATEAVKRGLASAPTGLKLKTVGNVSYEYETAMLDFTGASDARVIDKYTRSETTWELRATGERRYGYEHDRFAEDFIANGPDSID